MKLSSMDYSAKQDYQSEESALGYEQRPVYSGFMGRRRAALENRVISGLIDGLDNESVILDCPCGNGRWMFTLAKSAREIIGRDISVGMVSVAKTRAKNLDIPIEISISDAERLDLTDGSVDYVFSYALMKHLPLPVQYSVLSEFARVTRKQIICSFAVLRPFSMALWSRRRPQQSYPVIFEELEYMAQQNGLELKKTVKISQPLIGLEYFAVFEKKVT